MEKEREEDEAVATIENTVVTFREVEEGRRSDLKERKEEEKVEEG